MAAAGAKEQQQEQAAGKYAPRAPLPPIILSNVPGTWAYDTMSRRVRENILMRIYEVRGFAGTAVEGTHCCCCCLLARVARGDSAFFIQSFIGFCSPLVVPAPLQENDMESPELAGAKAKLDALVAELTTPTTSLLQPVAEDGGPDVAEWNGSIMAPYLGMNW
jgi:hypothetical protein